MFSVSFSSFLTLHFFLVVISFLYLFEFYFLASYGRAVYWYIRKISGSLTLISYKEANFYVNLQIFLVLILKLPKHLWTPVVGMYSLYIITFLVFFKVVLFLAKLSTVDRESLSTSFTILIFSYLVLANIPHVDNLIIFLFILELMGVVYYFFFLNKLSQSTLTILKYKNLLTMYLWTSFLILLTMSISLLFIVYKCGALNFTQISYFTLDINQIILHFLMFSLFWKIGAPGYHFFKLQIYQFLPLYSLMLFSSLSLFVNFFFLQFMLIVFFPIFYLTKSLLLVYIMFFNIVLLLRAQTHLPFYDFFAYSAINTMGTLLLFGLF